MSQITIVGAGAAGVTLALLLQRAGHRVSLFDGRGDPRGPAGAAYRSVAVTLSERGFSVLRKLGLEAELQKRSMPVDSRVMHTRTGEVFKQAYAASGQVLRCVSRLNLDLMMLDAIEKDSSIQLHFQTECQNIDFAESRLTFKDKTSNRVFTVESDFIIGADGPGSQLRQRLEKASAVHSELISFSGGYKEFAVPASPQGNWVLDPTSVHMWPRGDYVFIAFPVLAGEFIGMLFMPNNDHTTNDPAEVRNFITKEFSDLVAIAPHVADRCADTPITPLRRLRCQPWTYSEKFTLIGDAAHTILPFYGQGMNATLEDCEVLAECIAGDPDHPLSRYQALRKPNTDAIDELALEHYHYLSAFAETPESIRKKALEAELSHRFPADFVPVYTLIAFTSLPYSTCQRIHHMQVKLLDDLAQIAGPFAWESPQVQSLVESYREQHRLLRVGDVSRGTAKV